MLYLNYSWHFVQLLLLDLTLTSVVFELDSITALSREPLHLTLTSVVFELIKAPINLSVQFYLTLTSVVFEFKLIVHILF